MATVPSSPSTARPISTSSRPSRSRTTSGWASEGLALGGQFTYSWARPDLGDPAIEIESRTLFATVEATYPFLRRQARTLRGSLGFDYIDQDVDFSDLPLNRDRLRVAFARLTYDALGLAANDPRYRPVEPRWRIGASLEARQGLDIFGASDPCGPTLVACFAPGVVPPTRLEGDPTATVLRGAAYGEYRPDPRFTIAAAGRGQYSGNPLFSFEEYSAGNYTVGRGYDPGAILGDSGLGFQAELRYGTLFPRDPRGLHRRAVRLRRPGLGLERGFDPGGRRRGADLDRRRPARRLGRPASPRGHAGGAARSHHLPARSRPAPAGFAHHAPVAMELAMKAHSPRPDSGPSGRLRAKRRSLLFSCAIGSALALAAQGEQAQAQAFQADPTTIAGGVVYNRATPGIETITVTSDSAIINWEPNVPGNPIPFLPAGNVATFQNGPSNNDFVVLNRITAIDPVRFDGTVLGRLQGAGGGTPGGTILFSSPGGIIVGASALFDVGSLVLTTLNVVDDGAGNFITPGGGFEFNLGGDFPNAAIITEAGSQIVASAENSYVAFVAPVIVHGGSVSVNGSAAYIAGEELEFTVNQGLFDIIVTTGSDNPTPITHAAGASTGGPASTGGTDNHAVYMVAVPKNQAIQMLLEGSVGFQPAISASIENGVIILSSGFGVTGTAIQDIPPSPLDADIVITGGDFTSDVNGRASTEFRATALDDDLAFAGDLNMRGGTVATLGATGGLDTSVGGDLVIRAAASPEPDGIGGEAAVFADPGSSVTITGDALVDASGLGVIDELGAVGNGTGGTARVTADNGTIAFGGNLELRATGEGAAGVSTPDQGGFGQGGDIQLTADNGSVTVAGDLLADATGIGSASNGSLPGAGTVGTGGDILVRGADSGNVTVTGASQLRSLGVGGDVEDGAGTGGAGQGGNVDVEADNGDVDLGTSSGFDVTGFGGQAPNGGTGAGGTVTVSALAGEVALGASATIEALGHGGSAAFVPGGNGGAGTGGTIELRARGGTGGSLINGGTLTIVTQGDGGNGGDSDGLVVAGAGADGRGGDITLVAETGDGSLQFQDVLAQANGIGGSGGFGSGPVEPGPAADGFGGNVTVGTETGPAGPGLAADASFAALDLEAFGFGGNGASGGTGTGGQIGLVAVAGTQVNVSGPSGMSADGFGGAGFGLGGAGGAGIGGGARIGAQGNVSLLDFAISANGVGGPGLLGAGGAGQGGLVDVSADGADLDINGVLLVLAIGSGGGAGDPAAAGADAIGGNIRIRSGNGGAINVATASILSAAASGGTALPGAGSQGGQGLGGAIDVIASGGTVATWRFLDSRCQRRGRCRSGRWHRSRRQCAGRGVRRRGRSRAGGRDRCQRHSARIRTPPSAVAATASVDRSSFARVPGRHHRSFRAVRSPSWPKEAAAAAATARCRAVLADRFGRRRHRRRHRHSGRGRKRRPGLRHRHRGERRWLRRRWRRRRRGSGRRRRRRRWRHDHRRHGARRNARLGRQRRSRQPPVPGERHRRRGRRGATRRRRAATRLPAPSPSRPRMRWSNSAPAPSVPTALAVRAAARTVPPRARAPAATSSLPSTAAAAAIPFRRPAAAIAADRRRQHHRLGRRLRRFAHRQQCRALALRHSGRRDERRRRRSARLRSRDHRPRRRPPPSTWSTAASTLPARDPSTRSATSSSPLRERVG